MTERRDAAGRPPRAPLPRRSRRRWAAAAGVSACWVVLLTVTGSAVAATLLLAVLAGLGVVSVLALRALGITRDHPWVRQMAARPWRDGQDVLQLALRHLPEVFVVTPSGSLLAPNLVEVRLNPDDLGSLSERIDLSLVAASAAEVYEEQVAAHGARLGRPGPADVRVIADPAVPAGRYHLRQGQPVDAGPEPGFQFMPQGPGGFINAGPQRVFAAARPAAPAAYTGPPAGQGGPQPAREGRYPGFVAHDGGTRAQPEQEGTVATGLPTVLEPARPPVPLLRLVTGDSVAQTRTSGARAGRGAVELGLPEVPTVSREHARFTFSDGQWWIANLGRNGLTLNGAPLVAEHPLGNGDSIRWGTRPDALLSRVEIG
jgi:FHA domain